MPGEYPFQVGTGPLLLSLTFPAHHRHKYLGYSVLFTSLVLPFRIMLMWIRKVNTPIRNFGSFRYPSGTVILAFKENCHSGAGSELFKL